MDFPELLQECRVPVLGSGGGNKHCREGWIQFDCPFCSPNFGKYLMGYSLSGNYCNCYQCGGHSLVSTLAKLTGKNFRECKDTLKELDKPVGFRKEVEYTGKLEMPAFCEEMTGMHRKYLRGRGFDPEYCERIWKFQGIGNFAFGGMKRRVVIPVTYRGRIVSWTARAVDPDAKLRYISASREQESLHHKDILFGCDFVQDTAIIVEGPLDAVRIGRGAVATCGLGWKQKQLLEMTKIPYRYICFDSEKEAQKRAERLAETLSGFGGETHIVTIDADDAAEATDKEIKKLRRAIGLDERP